MSNISDKKVLLLWPNGPHTFGYMLKPFLLERVKRHKGIFTYIGHPVPLKGGLFHETEYVFAKGAQDIIIKKYSRTRYLGIWSLLIDWLYTAYLLIKCRSTFDVCISMSIHLVLLNILLKKVNIVRKVVIVFEEYASTSLHSKFVRYIYRLIAKLCVNQADYVTYTTLQIQEQMLNDGVTLNQNRSAHVPLPLDLNDFALIEVGNVIPNSILWVGQLLNDYGFDLVIDAMELVNERNPNAFVDVISYTTMPNTLFQKIKDKNLENHFRLLGYIEDEDEFLKNVRKHRVALAIYRPGNTTKSHADVIRPWVYMSNGVPHIINRYPAVASQIAASDAGIVINFDKRELADAIIKVLSNNCLYENFRLKGYTLAKTKASGPIFNKFVQFIGYDACAD